MRCFILAAVAALCFPGCTTAFHERFEEHPPRKPDSPIDFFLAPDVPVWVMRAIPEGRPSGQLPEATLIIGKIDSWGAAAATWSAVRDRARDRARELGGDALEVLGPLVGDDGLRGFTMHVHRYEYGTPEERKRDWDGAEARRKAREEEQRRQRARRFR